MRVFIALLMVFILAACSNKRNLDRDMELKAVRISRYFKDGSVNVFKKWGFFKRGDLFVWMRLKDGEVRYSLNYLKVKDTVRLSRALSESFKADFATNLQIDISKYGQVYLYNTGNLVKISGEDTIEKIHILANNLPVKQLFPKDNPFKVLGALSAIADSLGIRRTFHNDDLGNFIELNLSSQHVLYYVPDNLWIAPAPKKVWLAIFSRGKIIKKNWILVKLDKPKDI